MARFGTVIESTSGTSKEGITGIKKTTSKELSDLVAYRLTDDAAATKVVYAAFLFYENRKKYSYKLGGNYGGEKVTEADIKKPKYKTVSCIGLANGCVNFATDLKVHLNYGANYLPDNWSAFKKVGNASSHTLKPGDILVRPNKHYMIYVGAESKPDITQQTATPTQNTGKKLQNRWRYPSDSSNKYYYDSKYNPFCGSGGNGPPSAYHNCTWYAYGRFSEIAGLKGKSGLPTCDAQSWWTRYQGKNVGSTPKAGAVVVWASHHVAVVEKVFSNGDFITSNSAWNSGSPSPGKKPSNEMASHVCTNNKSDFTAFPYFYTEYVTKASGYMSNCGKPQGFIYHTGDFYSLGDTTGNTDTVQVMDMKDRIAKLKASDNFHYVNSEDYKKTIAYKTTNKVSKLALNYIEHVAKQLSDRDSEGERNSTIPDEPFSAKYLTLVSTKSVPRVKIKKVSGTLLPTAELIEAPFIELDFDGYIVGSYMSALDDFPNYLSTIDVQKVNGKINQYKINLVHLIRTGEDPNVIDKLLSKVRYKKITLRYGDCMSGKVYRDEKVIISNVTMKRDYRGNSITYTLHATSAGTYVSTVKFDFPAVTDKPSNVIRDLLYHNPDSSALLQEAFPEMRSAVEVDSKGYIPNNDAVVDIPAQKNMSPIDYINYLVATMSNEAADFVGSVAKAAKGTAKVVNGIVQLGLTAAEMSGIPGVSQAAQLLDTASTYFITYMDDKFKISEIKVLPSEDKLTESVTLTNVVYNVVINYPDENFVMDFSVDNDQSWSLLYNEGSISSEYVYAINRDGLTTKTYSPSIASTNAVLNQIQSNWWNQMTNFPISATLTLRGSLQPLNLMDYINIDVRFYGQSHHTSGTYVITGQQDVISKSGFRTHLSLLRVSK